MWQYLAYAVFIAAGALAVWSLYRDLKRLVRYIREGIAEAYDERNWH